MRKLWFGSLILILNTSCKPLQNASQVSTTNGIAQQPEQFKAIVKLKTTKPTDKPNVIVVGSCTGTFVSPTTLITASHCIKDMEVEYNNVKPKLKKSLTDMLGLPKSSAENDVAILVFPQAIAPAWIPLSSKALKKGDSFITAGFGAHTRVKDENGGDGSFRYGVNKVVDVLKEGRMFDTHGTPRKEVADEVGLNSMSAPGDSGGPALREGRIVGIVSGGGELTGVETVYSLYATVVNPDVQKFFDQMKAEGADIRFDGVGTVNYEECFDVSAQKGKTHFNFKVPHVRVSKVTGSWAVCECEECPLTTANGHKDGKMKDFQPVYKNVPAAALIVWGQKNQSQTKKMVLKGKAYQDNALDLSDHVFSVDMQIHGRDFNQTKDQLNVCFL